MTALSAAAATPFSRAALALGMQGTHAVEPIRVRPFPLSAVRLRPGPARAALELNRRYLLELDIDRLLHMFRLTAGLPSSAPPRAEGSIWFATPRLAIAHRTNCDAQRTGS